MLFRSAVDEHGLLTLEMTRQEQRRRAGAQSNHGHPCSECLDREHELRTHLIGEVLEVGCDTLVDPPGGAGATVKWRR